MQNKFSVEARFTGSETWQNRADYAIAHGALTNSKRPSCFVEGVYPTHLTHGQGAFVWDTDKKKYIDFICGLGSSILGYADAGVTKAVAEYAAKGPTLPLSSTLEVEVAEQVKAVFPFIDKLRFLKTGSDACSAAIKIARAYTGRDLVLSANYHGWSDDFVSLTPPALGVPKRDFVRSLDENIDNAAAVIVEPIVTTDDDARRQYLTDLRYRCDKTRTVLIFDEVITGFRVPLNSVTKYYGVTPDLICLGKAIANGFPLSVVGGRRDLMDCGEYFISSTFSGEMCSLAAAKETIRQLTTKRDLRLLWEKGKQFQASFNSIWSDGVWIEGYPTRGVFRAKDELTKALFFQECCLAGILVGSSFFFNYAHCEEVVYATALQLFRDIVLRIKTGGIELKGSMPRSPFAQQMRDNK